jgi:hypothetical protein
MNFPPIFPWQELVHWAGTVCVGRGELEITFDELLDAMHASRRKQGR